MPILVGVVSLPVEIQVAVANNVKEQVKNLQWLFGLRPDLTFVRADLLVSAYYDKVACENVLFKFCS